MIDPSGYIPADVRASAERLRDTGRYVFVSSVSVYADFSTGPDRVEPAAELGELPLDELTPDFSNYGPLKALSETEVERVFGERALIVRPGLIVGPHDPTGRFTYWARRLAPRRRAPRAGVAGTARAVRRRPRPGRLDPGRVEQGLSGTFNATNEGVAWGELLAGADVTWVTDEFLQEHEVGPWMELPLWLPDPEWAGMHATDVSRAVAAGLRFRPLAETIAGAAGAPAEEGVGLTPEREAELLTAWHGANRRLPRPRGAHSARGAALLFLETEADALPSFSDVVAPCSGRVEAGVLPIESSICGPVAETHDLLVDPRP